ncbi:putative fatty acyl-CoA reductase CG5065 [Chironomus tepperi]|uniref:putative fatty acyl-CoA reductase CG5065 n=1 Tax=Chironomus tepperi TaxID=113505 RepID=UPI00391F895C
MEVPKSQQPQISIAEFYNGKSVFVTGGLGFVGKVLVEKLLRSCPGIENIYLLCRSKKGKSINERLVEITSSPAFDLLREQNPQALNKIILIEGDVAMLELGISNEDQQILKDKVSIVMHSAATINFTEPLKVAVNTNLRSMRELIALANGMKNLKAFVHISTAYTNWFAMDVKEEVYPTELDPHDVIEICERFPDNVIDRMTPTLFGKHTTTYTFTKALAERLLHREGGKLPACIIRPSMVGGSTCEPKPGWTDSFGASTLFLYLAAKGAFRCVQHLERHPFDIIPVDKVINLAIAASVKASYDRESGAKIMNPQVYHSTSGNENPITLKESFDVFVELGRIKPLNDVSWYPKTRVHKSALLVDLDIYFLHYLPAYWMDFAAKLFGKKPRALKSHQFIFKSYGDVRFASVVPYIFRTSNYKNVTKLMSPAEQKIFNFDPKTINWKTYMVDYYYGIKNFILRDIPKDPEYMNAKIRRLKYTKNFVTGSLVALSLTTVGTLSALILRCRSDKKEK